ncbi:aminoglycoside phosphotransferase [Pyrenophora tritici-repentis]|nr:aminoglycoside phosphotransferase [Pyrenophora tritici-repentis]KAI1665108.1 Phosphotransferase enzyme protein [Pyrenophora tritici-repentis]PZD01093.1 Phosphotransferase family protein [Pyrenophora tritici-repentis]
MPYNNQIAALPFGLVLKWSDGTRLEEVAATLMARSAGFPVPKVISYGDHPKSPRAPMSILMTRIPGKDMGDRELYESMTDDERESIFAELQCILQVMRKWTYPGGKNQICSVLGTAIRSVRIPNHADGPCQSESEFDEHLFSCISGHSFNSWEKFEETVEIAERLRKMRHPIVFTHGDFKHHNVMIMNGHITAFLDWESAGWYPDYWEFTTLLRFGRKDHWWNSGCGDWAVKDTQRNWKKILLPMFCCIWFSLVLYSSRNTILVNLPFSGYDHLDPFTEYLSDHKYRQYLSYAIRRTDRSVRAALRPEPMGPPFCSSPPLYIN